MTIPSSSSSSPPPPPPPPSSSFSSSAEGTSCTIIGSLLIGAGLYAFHRTRSNVFLAGGMGVGAGYILSGAMMQTGREMVGHTAAASASMVILTTGISRYRTTKNAFPALPLIALGLLSTVYHLDRAGHYRMEQEKIEYKS